MKKRKLLQNILLFIAFLNCNYISALTLPDTQRVVQQICYFSKDAKEVYLVWGINNWNLIAEELRPEGTFIKENVLFTPMKSSKGIFSANLSVQPKTQIDYKFWITKGPLNKEVNIWDTNSSYQKDYHTIILTDNMILHNSKIKIRPPEALTIIDFSMPYLSITCCFLLLFMILRERLFNEKPLVPDFVKIIISGGIILFVVLALIRSTVMGFSWDLYLQPLLYIPKLIWAGFYDLVFVGIVCGVFLILNHIFEKHYQARKVLIILFIIGGVGSIMMSLLNIQQIEKLGVPLSYKKFYLIEGISLIPNLTFAKIIQIISVCCASVFAGMFLSFLSELLIQKVTVKQKVISSLVCASFIYLTIAPKAVMHYSWKYEKMANPVISFFGSEKFIPDKKIFKMEISNDLKAVATKNTGSYDHLKITTE
jgi:hypothetical protein